MRPSSMKIPPLNELYQQHQSYQAHRRKIDKIMNHSRSQSVQETLKDNHQRKYLQNFERKNNSKSLEIAKANTKILEKLKNAKPSLSSVKQYIHRSSDLRSIRSASNKHKIQEQEKQNYRIGVRVRTMNSSLSKDSMMRDYHRSLQIKNRLSHFKTQGNNKVVLKASRYLGVDNSKSQSKIINKPRIPTSQATTHVASSQKLNKELMADHKINKDLINMRLRRVSNNIASYYKKEQVIKNKIANTNKLFKLTRQKRIKTMLAFQKEVPLSKVQQNQEQHGLFPTAVARGKI